MVKINKFIFIIIVFMVTIFFFLGTNSQLDKKIILARFSLAEKAGFNLTPGELSFGNIGINQSATRDITISNNFDNPIIVSIESSGEISKNLIVSENNFKLNPKESKDITFSAYTRGLTEFKEYSGEVIIVSEKV